MSYDHRQRYGGHPDDEAEHSFGMEKLGIDPAFEGVIALADTSIVHTAHGRFRFERLLSSKRSRRHRKASRRPAQARSPSPPPVPPKDERFFDPPPPPPPPLARTPSLLSQPPTRRLRDSACLPEVDHSKHDDPLPDELKEVDVLAAGTSDSALRIRWSSSERSSISDRDRRPSDFSFEPPGLIVDNHSHQSQPRLYHSASDVWPTPVRLPSPDASMTSSPPAYAFTGRTDLLDTNAAIVVTPDSPSLGRREEERPGEVLVVQLSVGAAPSVRGPFYPGWVSVFRHSLTGDLRLVTVTNDGATREVDRHVVKAAEVELVPTYAYDFRLVDVLYLQSANPPDLPRYNDPIALTTPLGLVYKFRSTGDMLEFQGKVLEEDVCFDISNVRSVVLAVAGGHTREINSPRLQLWHQRRSKGRLGDNGSFLTSGTKLSASDPERTELLYARLVVYLGRSQEFITFFELVTDDVSYRKKGETTLIFSGTTYGGIDMWRSRRNLRCGLVKRRDGPAGIRLNKHGLNVDDQTSFRPYKTFEVAFEDESGRLTFLETWEQMIQTRRIARERIRKVQQAMSKKAFTGTMAAKMIG